MPRQPTDTPPTDTYTHGHHESVLRSHRWRTAENSAGYLLPHLSTGQRMLDIGCGPGNITCDLARLVAPATVIGADLAADVIAQATTAIPSDVTNVSFETADIYSLRFADASFDVVHAHQVLQHLSDPVAALREMRRVVAPGGVVAARDSDYQAFTWAPGDPLLSRWLEIYRATAIGNKATPDAGRYLLGWAQEAGFADVTASASVWCYADDESRAWWGGLWADRILQSAFATQSVEQRHTTVEELTEISNAWRQWSTAKDGWFAVLHGEVLCRD